MSSPTMRRIQDEHKVVLVEIESAAIVVEFNSTKRADSDQNPSFGLSEPGATYSRLSLTALRGGIT